MSGAGHVMNMINRIKQNVVKRPSIRTKFREHHREDIYLTEKIPERSYFRRVAATEQDKI